MRGHSLTEQGSLITDELRQCIGEPRTPRIVHIEHGAIAVFASAIGDVNPLFTNDIHARGTRYGGITAPPTFLRSVSGEGRELFEESGLENVLDGGSEWSYFTSVYPGDHITAVTTILDLTERDGRLGRMVFVASETVYTNQFDQIVAKQRSTIIRY
jgi:acyl dehydratase